MSRAATSNARPSGIPQGTPGGKAHRPGLRQPVAVGEEMYLWILVFIEVGVIAWMRSYFRRYHGG
jgi:hypothetical protein